MGVFDDVKAIEALDEMRRQAEARARQLMQFADLLGAAYETHRKDADAHPAELTRCADAARELIEQGLAMDLPDPSSGQRPASDAEPKRGRGPDRKPRKVREVMVAAEQAAALKDADARATAESSAHCNALLCEAFSQGPLTLAGIEATIGWPPEEAKERLLANDGFTTWVMKREGDSEPVAVWGTTAQRDSYVATIPLQARGKASDASR